MNSQQTQNFESDYDQFIRTNNFLFLGKDEKGCWTMEGALRLLRTYTKLYITKNNADCSSQSAFKIVADALASEGDIKPIPGSELLEEEESPDLTAEQYHALSARQVAFRYRSDPDFKRQVESLIAQGLI
jgi:hypothetical protein